MSQICYSSIPLWARTPLPGDSPPPDRTGTAYLLVGVGPDARAAVRNWSGDLSPAPVRALLADDPGEGGRLLAAALHESTVGTRVRIAGPAGACLRLRGIATAAGVEDDELYARVTGAGIHDVYCAHCATVTAAAQSVGEIAGCSGCGRDLVVYHHVSRRTGEFLGFAADAEQWSP
ncbi:dimethylamine monooxygenase subunit DmmA family protein [Nocardia sp. NPDC024068]|uniref:dimethylamine monooxygenase subunit DmmA family protein n=1 Tax=Nocardia sp. NPDC024068 TaxID=3157197 RepID=UPI00340116BF